jgi:hypothetical protein
MKTEIGGTTDAADWFGDRETTKTIDGASIARWFSEDGGLSWPRETAFEQFRDAGVDGLFTDFPDVAALVIKGDRR